MDAELSEPLSNIQPTSALTNADINQMVGSVNVNSLDGSGTKEVSKSVLSKLVDFVDKHKLTLGALVAAIVIVVLIFVVFRKKRTVVENEKKSESEMEE